MKTKKERQNIYQKVTDQIIAEMEKGIVPWQQGWNDYGMPRNYISGRRYSGINLLFLNYITHVRGYETPIYLTFKQAKDLGGKIKKGEHGTTIIYWAKKVYKSTKSDEDREDETIKLFPVGHYVFNIDQTEGINFDDIVPLKNNNIKPIEECEHIIKGMPNSPKMQHGGDQAYYSRLDDLVQIPNKNLFNSTEEYYQTFFHELIHSTGHESRLNRKDLYDSLTMKNNSYSKEELTAEIGASFLSAHAGIEKIVISNSASYINNWMKALKDDRTLLIRAASLAGKAVDYILNNQDDPAGHPDI